MTAIVTGAAGGIGGAIAERLALDATVPAPVVLVDATERVHEVAAQLAARGARAVGCVADIAAADAGERVLAAVAPLGELPRLLVNNAGITRDGRAGDLAQEDVRAVLRVNLVAPLRLIEALAPRLADGGAVVNIASRAALGNFGQANYVMAKAGLAGATRALARRWAPRLRVNAVAPGLVDTAMTQAMPPQVLERLVARVPAARAGRPQEIAELVAFLGSPEQASYVTGQVVFACGGRSIA